MQTFAVFVKCECFTKLKPCLKTSGFAECRLWIRWIFCWNISPIN